MKSSEACKVWVGVLRSVASGEASPAEALRRIPSVDDEDDVPPAFWSARDLLDQEVEFGTEEPDEHFRAVMTKLADRIEQHPKAGPR
ncbi:MAG TPA: hypothetical protein VFP58_01725 [Candidatus Eisenbacteria bacterium]|nr:hypothetical protein [Candidatus Eisenbacteria bacterium]